MSLSRTQFDQMAAKIVAIFIFGFALFASSFSLAAGTGKTLLFEAADGTTIRKPECVLLLESSEIGKVLRRTHKFTENDFKLINQLVTVDSYQDGVHRDQKRSDSLSGVYRQTNFLKMGADFTIVPKAMQEFILWLNTAEANLDFMNVERFVAEAFIRFIDIHPFNDGNGRTGRLLIQILLLKNGRPGYEPSLVSKEAYLTGYASLLPWDAEFLAQLIQRAQQGESTVNYSRYGGLSIRPTPLTPQQLLSAKRITSTDFLEFCRDYIGAAYPSLEIMKAIYSKTNLTPDEYLQFLGILRAAMIDGHPQTVRELKDLLNYFGNKQI